MSDYESVYDYNNDDERDVIQMNDYNMMQNALTQMPTPVVDNYTELPKHHRRFSIANILFIILIIIVLYFLFKEISKRTRCGSGAGFASDAIFVSSEPIFALRKI
jgi:hypothetical protein